MIVILDYGVGNVHSVANALHKIQADAVISDDPAVIRDADRLIVPGVGAFDEGMKGLRDHGVIPALERKVMAERTPVLGICLGLQLLTRRSAEGRAAGLGWLEADTVAFDGHAAGGPLKIPHMGWNNVTAAPGAAFPGGLDGRRFYFAHAYHVHCDDPAAVVARARYGLEFAAVVRSANILGTQFHPEKSLAAGLELLTAFVERG